MRNASEVFVKLLSKDEFTTAGGRVVAAQGRRGTGRNIEWYGWCKFSPVYFLGVFNETDKGDMEAHFEYPDKRIAICW